MEHSEFSALYRRWYRPMLLYARSLTGDLAAAEDLVQNAFAKALLSYRAGGSVRAWLATVLRNEFLSQKRREKMYAVPLRWKDFWFRSSSARCMKRCSRYPRPIGRPLSRVLCWAFRMQKLPLCEAFHRKVCASCVTGRGSG